MISYSSIKNFTIINAFLFLLSAFQYATVSSVSILNINTVNTWSVLFLTVYTVLIIRNYVLVYFIDNSIKNKPSIHSPSEIDKGTTYELHKNLIITTALEAGTQLCIQYSFVDPTQPSRLLYFIPLSFFFEILLDFFHYCAHRLLHHKSLYAYIHKKHHRFHHPHSMTTFYHHPLDILLTISLPTALSLCLLPSVSYFEFVLLSVYKIFSEISGHTGKQLAPTGSFPQFIWLPKWLSIDLYTEDHDLHHSMNNCNYAKRFSLWDKVFGTFRTV